MVRPDKRTRSVKKVKKKTPGGRTVTHFKAEKAKACKCGRCKTLVKNIATGSNTELSGMSKSKKGTSMPYSGVLCNKCIDTLVRYVTRMEVKHSNPGYKDLDITRDLTVEKFLPRGWYSDMSSGKVLLKKAKDKSFKKASAKPKKSKPKTKAKSPKGKK